MNKDNKIKILIVDDHAVVRLGLSTLLGYQKDLTVVGEADDGIRGGDEATHLRHQGNEGNLADVG